MTPEAQRIAIAEACGAEWYLYASGWTWLSIKQLKSPDWVKVSGPADPSKIVIGDTVPDYLNDLNDMHEAEKARWTGDLKRFHNDAAVYREWKEYEHLLRCNIHAEAKERAAAFVVVTGKWDDSK